jgi:hypothetical protein
MIAIFLMFYGFSCGGREMGAAGSRSAISQAAATRNGAIPEKSAHWFSDIQALVCSHFTHDLSAP